MHTSDVVGARVFENPWPVTAAYQQPNSQQPNPPSTPGGSIFASYMGSQGRMVPASSQEKPPPTGIGITRFAGGTFFPPGPQKSYHRKNLSLAFQNNSPKSHITTLVSERSPDSSVKPLRSTAIRRPNFFEKWRAGQQQDNPADINNSGLGNTGIRDDSDSDPSDEDGGVALASDLAVYMQGPGEIKDPLHQMAHESTHQRSEAQESELNKLNSQKVDIAGKRFPGSRSSINSQMATLLQAPGGLSYIPGRPSIPVAHINYSTPPTNYPVYRPSMGREREEEVEEEEEIYEREARSRSAHVETLRISDESGGISSSPAPSAKKYEDIDSSRYWRTPGTSSVYLRSTFTPPPTIPPTPQQKSGPPRPKQQERSERQGRRAFRHLRDGDIVGDEALELPKANKGRLIMEKMGYKAGTALGTNEDRGLTEPVKVEVRLGKRGLGLAKQEPVFPPHESPSQVNLNQTILPQTAPARVNREENTHEITRQFQQMDLIAFQQTVKYSLTTPLSACQTRLRMVQILAQLDARERLNIVDYNYILAVSMDKVAEKQSRSGFLVDFDLVEIVMMEYKMAVLRADQNWGGGSHGKMNKARHW